LSFDQLTGVLQVCCSVLRVVASVRSVVVANLFNVWEVVASFCRALK